MAAVDGRTLRRRRNVARAVNAFLDLAAERHGDVSVEHVAQRSGVSLRSLYRYFPTREDLLLAAVQAQATRAAELYRVADAGTGPLEDRAAFYVEHRLLLHQVMAPLARQVCAAAPSMARLRSEVVARRAALEGMVRAQFAPELAAMSPTGRDRTVLAVHVLCQRESMDTLVHEKQLPRDEVHTILTSAIIALLTPVTDARRADP